MEFRRDVALAPYTTFRIGGPARWFAEAQSEADVTEAVAFARRHDLPLFVLGGGSNLLVSDEGFGGVVLRIALRGIEEQQQGDRSLFRVAAGEDWDTFVALAIARGCSGLECLSGIPGTVGGTPVQNVGAYGQEVSQTIVLVRAYDRKTDTWLDLDRAACGFAYRRSIFNSTDRDRYIVTRVNFSLPKSQNVQLSYPDLKKYFNGRGSLPSLVEVRDAVRAIRHGKGMLLVDGEADCRSAGSFFKNPVIPESHLARLGQALSLGEDEIPRFAADPGKVKVPAAWLLDQAGFHKGYGMGNAGISTRHTLALTNRGDARAADVVALRDHIQETVEAKFGIRLEPEPVWVA